MDQNLTDYSHFDPEYSGQTRATDALVTQALNSHGIDYVG